LQPNQPQRAIKSPLFELARVLVRLDHCASAHLDDSGSSDFYLYTNLPGARLCDLYSRPHLLKQRRQRGVAVLITNTIADLRQQIHDDLRRQHPEWVLPNGECPMCDAYEARLMDLLALESASKTTPDREATHRR
jgi:hypothetical protein